MFRRDRCFTSVFTGYGVLDGIILIVIYSLLTVVRLMWYISKCHNLQAVCDKETPFYMLALYDR